MIFHIAKAILFGLAASVALFVVSPHNVSDEDSLFFMKLAGVVGLLVAAAVAIPN